MREGLRRRARPLMDVYALLCVLVLLGLWMRTGSPTRDSPPVLAALVLIAAVLLLRLPPLEPVRDRLADVGGHLDAVNVHPALFLLTGAALVEGARDDGRWSGVVFGLGVLSCSALLLAALVRVATADGRQEVLGAFRHLGRLAPVAYAVPVVVLAVLTFGSLLTWSSRHGADVVTADGRTPVPVGQALLFFGWLLIEAVPVLELPSSFGWSPPVEHTSVLVGSLVVAFKVAVLAPLLAFLSAWWRDRTGHREVPEQPLPPAPGGARRPVDTR